jgi:hypothetical protein
MLDLVRLEQMYTDVHYLLIFVLVALCLIIAFFIGDLFRDCVQKRRAERLPAVSFSQLNNRRGDVREANTRRSLPLLPASAPVWPEGQVVESQV